MTPAEPPTPPSSRRWRIWLIVLALVAAAGIGLWAATPDPVATGSGGVPPPAERLGEAPSAGPTAGIDPVVTPRVALPAIRIPDKGRLSVDRESLREGDLLALGLEMPDESRGAGPRPTRIVDPERGRVLDLEAVPIDGAGTGVRLEIDPEWLEPGAYMIMVEVENAGPLPARRYVLEVRAPDADAADR